MTLIERLRKKFDPRSSPSFSAQASARTVYEDFEEFMRWLGNAISKLVKEIP